ncbi:mucin-5AC-like [Panicum virgatum]|uniref:mucin-5AC-like n=1 Tax=Panicum virgatum TaxID=38727 RepID=UPI0019D6806B|nr:mucin-5AC-like [Panicum virgatum]
MEVAAPRVELVVRIDKAKLHCPCCSVPLKIPMFQFQVCLCFHCYQQWHPLLVLVFLGRVLAVRGWAFWPAGTAMSTSPRTSATRASRMAPTSAPPRWKTTSSRPGSRALSTSTAAGPMSPTPRPATTSASAPRRRAAARSPAAPSSACRRCSATTSGTRTPGPWTSSVTAGRTTSASRSSQPRRLLELDAEEDDGRVFFVSVGARGATVACVRTAAAAGPQFSCKMWATGNPSPATGRVEMAIVEADVPSISSVPGDAAARDAVPLLVPRRMLHGASMEMHLSVRIDKAPE